MALSAVSCLLVFSFLRLVRAVDSDHSCCLKVVDSYLKLLCQMKLLAIVVPDESAILVKQAFHCLSIVITRDSS